VKTRQFSKKQREIANWQLKTGRMSRREFMRALTLLGVSCGAATIAAQCSPSASGGVPSAGNTGFTSVEEPALVEGALLEPASLIGEEVVAAANQLEILAGWGDGGDALALQLLFDIYRREYPKIEIINAIMGGVAGFGMNEILETRLQGNQPPDSFQVHLGHELIDTYAVAGHMEPLDFLYEEEGWNDVFPPDLLTIASWDGHPWSVPVNIHRSNVLWWNPRLFQEAGIDAPPETFDEFFTAAARLKDAGFDGILFGESEPGFTAHVFEGILAGFLTPDQYRGLWTGETDWNGSDIEAALMFLKETLENFANEDYLSVGWGDGRKRFEESTAGMMIMGDWQNGQFKASGFTDYAWAPVMGTKDVFMVLSDSFGLPKGAPHRENAINWLRVLGSKEAQEKFNIIKGSIPARTDVDPTKFDAYQRSAIEDFKVNELVPSVVHGAAANDVWKGEYVMALHTFANNKDINQARENLVRACEEVGACG
jgi:glucose/mannose transport system substrate-binding protein